MNTLQVACSLYAKWCDMTNREKLVTHFYTQDKPASTALLYIKVSAVPL